MRTLLHTIIPMAVSFAFGYALREWISRRRRAAARRKYYERHPEARK
jgi:hypothetical protein